MFSGLERERERGNTDHSRCNKPQPVENDWTSFKSWGREGGL